MYVHIHMYKGDWSISRGYRDLSIHSWEEAHLAAASFLNNTASSVAQLCPLPLCLSVPHCKFFKEKSPLLQSGEASRPGSSHSAQGSMVKSQPLHLCLCVRDHFDKRNKSWQSRQVLLNSELWVKWSKRRGLGDKVNILKLKARDSLTKEHHLHLPFTHGRKTPKWIMKLYEVEIYKNSFSVKIGLALKYLGQLSWLLPTLARRPVQCRLARRHGIINQLRVATASPCSKCLGKNWEDILH